MKDQAKEPCGVCGRPTGGCCTVQMDRPEGSSYRSSTYTLVHDENGDEYVVDEQGNKFIPEQTKVIRSKSSSGWVEYDSSRGHCGLCGSLTCGRMCFK